jgi:hypothetical protein
MYLKLPMKNNIRFIHLFIKYYAHREKLRVIGREGDLDKINRTALRIAREVADKHGCLMAGNICNSTVYVTGDDESHKVTESMFKVSIIVLPHKHGALTLEIYVTMAIIGFIFELKTKQSKTHT